MTQSNDRLDRFEDAFIRFTEQNNRLLNRVIDMQENQQRQLNEFKDTVERVMGHIDNLYDEIKGLRTESLRIQRHIFGDEVVD